MDLLKHKLKRTKVLPQELDAFISAQHFDKNNENSIADAEELCEYEEICVEYDLEWNVTSEIYENLHLIVTVSFIRVHEQNTNKHDIQDFKGAENFFDKALHKSQQTREQTNSFK